MSNLASRFFDLSGTGRGESAAGGVDGGALNRSKWHPMGTGDKGEFGVFVMGDHMADGSGVMSDSGGRVTSISAEFSALQSTSQVSA